MVSYQNESYLFALSFLQNSREDGGEQGSSHFDETLSFRLDTTVRSPVTTNFDKFLTKTRQIVDKKAWSNGFGHLELKSLGKNFRRRGVT